MYAHDPHPKDQRGWKFIYITRTDPVLPSSPFDKLFSRPEKNPLSLPRRGAESDFLSGCGCGRWELSVISLRRPMPGKIIGRGSFREIEAARQRRRLQVWPELIAGVGGVGLLAFVGRSSGLIRKQCFST